MNWYAVVFFAIAFQEKNRVYSQLSGVVQWGLCQREGLLAGLSFLKTISKKICCLGWIELNYEMQKNDDLF